MSAAVGPEVADKANPGPEGSPTDGTGMSEWSRGSRLRSGLASGTLLLRFSDEPGLGPMSSSGSLASPCWAVQGQCLPSAGVDTHMFEGHLQAVFVALPLPPCCALALMQFSVEELFGDSAVWHSGHMSSPPGLGFLQESMDTA